MATEAFALLFIWTFHSRIAGKIASAKSVRIETAEK